MRKNYSTSPDGESFWSRVAIAGPDDCWPWRLSIGTHGYGQAYDGKRTVLAHRRAWQLVHGPIPTGMLVCHTCDNKLCCNPAHFFLGTDKDNAMDKARKGRTAAKLSPDKVREIRRRHAAGGVSMYRLAIEFGVNRRAIVFAIRGVTWAHVEHPDPDPAREEADRERDRRERVNIGAWRGGDG